MGYRETTDYNAVSRPVMAEELLTPRGQQRIKIRSRN